MTHICARFISFWLDARTCLSINTCLFSMSVIGRQFAFLITWFLSHDKKRIRLLSAFLVGATWPMSFPVALLFSLF